MNKQELINKIDTYDIPDDIKVSIMADIADVESTEGVAQADYDAIVAERDDYRNRYDESIAAFKARFLTGGDESEQDHSDEETDEKVIDIKEI